MLSNIALGGIWAYQRYLSPRKGYRCAYSVAHGGTGCSGYAKHAIREAGLWRAIPAIRARFRDCRLAYETLLNERTDERAKTKHQTNQRNRNRKCGKNCRDASCYGAEGCTLLPGACAGAGARSVGAAGSSKFCDINPCDGDIGCGGCDVCSCG